MFILLFNTLSIFLIVDNTTGTEAFEFAYYFRE